MKKIFAAVCLLASLAACSSVPAPVAAPDKVQQPKIALDVKTISLADRTAPQMNSVFKANNFKPTIGEAIKQWAVDRMQASGQTGNAIIIIKDASLVSQPIPVKQDFFDNLFTRAQGMKYVGHAEVAIEANGRTGYAMANADATRVLTLPEEPTNLEKQEAYYTMLTGLMKDLGENLESSIKSHMSSFILDTSVNAAPLAPVSASSTPSVAPTPKSASTLDAPPLLSDANGK